MHARRLLLLAPFLALLAFPAAAAAGGRVASATGSEVVRGEVVQVDVVVAVAPGQTDRQATDEALRQQGAKRTPQGGSGSYAFNGLKWDVLPVTQSYNPAGDPVGAQSALTATESTWSSVSGSSYRVSFGGITSRCPSLTQGCKGPQSFDGRNDVGWSRLGGTTLAVTWFGTSLDEADMAVNTRFRWNTGCRNVSGSYDVQTVMLHENGHVAGLDHVSDPNQVMYPSYRFARCSLGSGDQAGIAALY